ncbi:antibiotic biosynthesis monooxygenase family protein [Celeribacter halophilus]|uniref:antibiotic biosynthesis monooxygenase family protein n=1 Tax=Celeribacter halophilus TaxID=576117 RepID=UPI001C081105|nr:antibiotic biosynthesis monooxygenase [Celeribacter halophilus]MBU2891686.1 antibiotic biosynthesis monooxygenase [Celeribacter halophilus]MDO6509844.1 antibiotic biosynthesis monooxygenase [Celeribacter halophilus]
MSFIAMNRFKITPGREEDFEEIWRNRESRLKELPGFVEFRMLKGPVAEDHALYSSSTLWNSKADFENWTTSEQFRDSHKNAGNRDRSIFAGPPQFEGFETIIHEA